MSSSADDIACVESSDITMDRVNAISKALHTARQSGLGDGAGGPATCDAITAVNSNFKDNTDYGIYLQGDKHYFLNNNISLNGVDGARISWSNTLVLYGNNFSDNSAAGLYLGDVRDSTIEANYFWSNGKYGIYILPNILTYNERVDVLSNDVYSNDYEVVLESLINSVINDNNIYGNVRGGAELADFLDSDFTNNFIDNNGGSGIHGWAGQPLDNITFYNNTVSRTTGDGILIESFTKRLVFEENRLVDNSGYGILVDDTSDIILNKTRIYGNIDKYFYVEGSSVFDTHDFWLGYNDTVGILWPAMKFDSVETDVTDSNLLLGEDFVSLDASDPLAAELNETAMITITVPGCALIRYYDLGGFPTSKNEIITNGAIFVPATKTCAGTLATFEVAGFSGYTANGTSFAPQPPGGGGGGEAKPLSISAETICPDNIVEFTVMSGGVPVSNVEVQLAQYEPYCGLIGEELTDDSGKTQFTIPRGAVYRVRFEKDGYYYVNPYVLEYAMCEEEEVVEDEIPEERPEEQPPVQEVREDEPPEAAVEPEIVPEEPVDEVDEIVSEPQPGVVPPEEEAQPPATAEEGKELCPLPVLLVILVVIAAGVYYWLAMRKRK